MFCHENGVYCIPAINSKSKNDHKNIQEEKTFGSFWVMRECQSWWVLNSSYLITGFAVEPSIGVMDEQGFVQLTLMLSPQVQQLLWSFNCPAHPEPPKRRGVFLSKEMSEFSSFPESVDNCPSNCYGNGDCVSGTCHCFLGFLGPDCGRGRNLWLINCSPLPFS